MTKSNYDPSTSRSASSGSIDTGSNSQAEHQPRRAASDDELEDTKLSDNDNGGGTAGTHGNGSAG